MSTEPIVVRASSADRIWACAQAIVPPTVPIELAAAPEASLGTAAHAALAYLVQGQSRATYSQDIHRLAQAHGVDLAELERLVEYGHQAWEEIRDRILEPEAEVYLEQVRADGKVIFNGHPDVLSRRFEDRTVPDWKSGWRADSGSCEHQMRMYCHLALAHRAVVVWLRERRYECFPGPGPEDRWGPEELGEWAAQLEHRCLHPDEYPYAPGDPCRFCPRVLECPALLEVQAGAIELFMDEEDCRELAPRNIVQAHQAIGMIEKRIKAFKATVKAQIAASGPIRGDDAELVLQPNPHPKIDVDRAWDVLASWFPKKKLAEVVTTTKTALKAAAEEHAPQGTKTATSKRLFNELQNAGAIDVTYGEPKLVRKALPKAKE